MELNGCWNIFRGLVPCISRALRRWRFTSSPTLAAMQSSCRVRTFSAQHTLHEWSRPLHGSACCPRSSARCPSIPTKDNQFIRSRFLNLAAHLLLVISRSPARPSARCAWFDTMQHIHGFSVFVYVASYGRSHHDSVHAFWEFGWDHALRWRPARRRWSRERDMARGAPGSSDWSCYTEIKITHHREKL